MLRPWTPVGRYSRLRSASVVGIVVVALSSTSARAQSAVPAPGKATSVAPATVALVETWPDGRTNYELTSPQRAWMWTPTFPRVADYRLPNGAKPVFAVQFVRVLVGRDINVDVSVLLGSAEQPGVPVASVVISPGSHVTIDALRNFGVQPVTLSMADVAPLLPFLPTVVSVSPQVEISSVELLIAPYPGYRITLRDLGSKGISNVHVQSYRGQEKALSTLKRSDDGRPVMEPGGSYTFDVNLTSGAADQLAVPGTWTPRPLDVIEFDSVRWDDGSYDGNPPFPHVDPIIESDSGRRLQLQRIIDALRAALAETGAVGGLLMSARARIDSLSDAEPDQLVAARVAMKTTKQTVRADLERFAADRSMASDDAARARLTSLLKRYEAWLARLSPP